MELESLKRMGLWGDENLFCWDLGRLEKENKRRVVRWVRKVLR